MHWTSPVSGSGGAHVPASGPPRVPGYRMERLLGRGASGPVWRARPFAGGDAVAVKCVPAGPGVERELALLRAIRHPFVVPLLDVVMLDDGVLALVFSLVDGGSLSSLVASRGHLTPGEVVTVLSPLARTLADLHARGVEHGDVAPSTVLLDRFGRPVLSDLGIVRLTGAWRGELLGTPGYVDPVVLSGGTAIPASDVYGLGAVGWFALTGAPPPAAPLRPRLAELVPEAPAALLDAVEAAVDPDPARRPEPLDLARAVHAACRPAPLWHSRAGPDDGDLTRRLRAACAGADPDGIADEGGSAGAGGLARDPVVPRARHRRERRMRPRLLVAGALGCGVAATGLAVALETPQGGAPGSAVPSTAAVGGEVGGQAGGAVGRQGAGEVRREVRGTVAGQAGGPAGGQVRDEASSEAGGEAGSGAGSEAGSDAGSDAGSGSATSRAPARSSGKSRPVAAPETTAQPSQASMTRPARAAEQRDRPRARDPARDGPYGDLRRPGTAQEVVRELLARRAAELGATHPEHPTTTVPGSPAAAVDAAERQSLVAVGLSYRGLRLSAREVSVRSASRRDAIVRVTADTSGYDVVDRAGRVRSRVPPGPGARVLLHLVLTDQGWRVAAVTAP